MRYFGVAIYCNGKDCQTETVHWLWAVTQDDAYRKARIELVRHHGWLRMWDHRRDEPVDFCPLHHPAQPRARTQKEAVSA